MTKSPPTVLVALVIIALSTFADAQQPTRDGAKGAGNRTGTGVVTGLVTLGDDARTPVRRAVVTLTTADGSETLAAISEDDGRFAIKQVPAGRYALEARKAAHLTIAYGARRPGRRGTLLIVAEGQRLNDLSLSLPQAAVLAGRVTLADGQPAPNTQMVAVPSWLATAGGTPATGEREFRTDDLGEFRLFGLMPDTYVVAALPSFGQGDVERMTDAAISDIFRQLQQPGTPATGSANSVAYAPTYFPGTPSVGDAARITVAAGQTREGLNFVIRAVPAASIRGRVLGLDGAPTQAVSLSIEAVGPALPVAATAVARIERPNRNGEFQIAGVSPGLYRLRARGGGVTLDANGASSIRAEAQNQYAAADITVSGSDVNGVVLALREGHHLSGTLTADRAGTSLAGVSVVVQPITNGPQSLFAGAGGPGVPTRNATADEAGRFAVVGLEPFAYDIRVTLPPPIANAGWHVDSIRYAGRDLRDAPLTFSAGSIEGVEIRLTTTVTELSGSLTSAAGTPSTDYFIAAFPADRALWHSTSPRLRILRPAADGTFTTRDLPAGAYRLAVLADVEDRDLRQQEFLESIYSASVAVTLTNGQTTRQELRVRGRRP